MHKHANIQFIEEKSFLPQTEQKQQQFRDISSYLGTKERRNMICQYTHIEIRAQTFSSMSLWRCDDGDGEWCVLTEAVTQSCIQHKNLRGKRLCYKYKTFSVLLQNFITKYGEVRRNCSLHTVDRDRVKMKYVNQLS